MNLLKPTHLLGALALAIAPLSATADFYVRAGAFYVKPGDVSFGGDLRTDMDSTVGLALAGGYKLSLVRLELEGQYYKADAGTVQYAGVEATASGSAKQLNLFANVLVDIPFPLPLIAPYAGIGVGIGRADLDQSLGASGTEGYLVGYSTSDNVLGYQVLAGVRFVFLETVTLHAGARYQNFDSFTAKELESATRNRISSGGTWIWEIGAGIDF